MTIRRLDGRWTGDGWGILTLCEGEGFYTDTFGGRPGDIRLEPKPGARVAGTWGQQDRNRGGTIALTLTDDWRRLTGTYLPRPDSEIGHTDETPVDLERLSFAWSEPVPAPHHIVQTAMTMTVGDQRSVNAPFLVDHAGTEAEIHIWRHTSNAIAIKLRHIWRGVGTTYRTATSAAVPAWLLIKARRERFMDSLTTLVGLEHDILTGLPALDDLAIFTSTEQRAAEHLLTHPDTARRLYDLFELHGHDLVIRGPAAHGELQVSWVAPPGQFLADTALDDALDAVLALASALRAAARALS